MAPHNIQIWCHNQSKATAYPANSFMVLKFLANKKKKGKKNIYRTPVFKEFHPFNLTRKVLSMKKQMCFKQIIASHFIFVVEQH